MDERTISSIAHDMLGIPTLDTRGSDGLDFYEISVWQLKKALESAYEQGVCDAKNEER